MTIITIIIIAKYLASTRAVFFTKSLLLHIHSHVAFKTNVIPTPVFYMLNINKLSKHFKQSRVTQIIVRLSHYVTRRIFISQLHDKYSSLAFESLPGDWYSTNMYLGTFSRNYVKCCDTKRLLSIAWVERSFDARAKNLIDV